MRIVLDTNVVLSALLWRGSPYRLFETLCQTERARMFNSTALLEELAEILIRPVPAKRLAMIGQAARHVLADYSNVSSLVAPHAVPPVIAADPGDDQVIACAVAARAELIVSGDRHLLELGWHESIRIVTPAEALAVIVAG